MNRHHRHIIERPGFFPALYAFALALCVALPITLTASPGEAAPMAFRTPPSTAAASDVAAGNFDDRRLIYPEDYPAAGATVANYNGVRPWTIDGGADLPLDTVSRYSPVHPGNAFRLRTWVYVQSGSGSGRLEVGLRTNVGAVVNVIGLVVDPNSGWGLQAANGNVIYPPNSPDNPRALFDQWVYVTLTYTAGDGTVSLSLNRETPAQANVNGVDYGGGFYAVNLTDADAHLGALAVDYPKRGLRVG